MIKNSNSLTQGPWPTLLAAVFLAFGAAANGMAGTGSQANPRIFPPQSIPYGKSYGEWSAAWWRWAAAFPVNSNPLLDQTGANAALGQSNSVWFLAGNTGG